MHDDDGKRLLGVDLVGEVHLKEHLSSDLDH